MSARKRTDFTLKIINAAKEPNQSKLVREIREKWSIEVKRTTVEGIFSKKDAIEVAIKSAVPSKRIWQTQAHDPKLGEGGLMWLKQARGQNLPVSGDLIKEKTMKLAELMHIPDFIASDGWLDNFRRRHGITFKTVQGEAGAVISSTWKRLESSGSCFRTNMSGSDKFPLLAIRNSTRPCEEEIVPLRKPSGHEAPSGISCSREAGSPV